MAKLTQEEILKAKAEYKAHTDSLIAEQRRDYLDALNELKQAPKTISKEEKKKLKETVKEEKKLLTRLIKIAKHHIKRVGEEEEDETELVPPDKDIFDAAMKD